MRSKYMICPALNLGSSAFAPVDCQLNPVFLWRDFVLPSAITDQVFRFVRRSVLPARSCFALLHCDAEPA